MYSQTANSWQTGYSSANLFDQNPNDYQIDDEGRFSTTVAPPPPPGPSPSLLYSSPSRYHQLSQQKRAEMSKYTPTKKSFEVRKSSVKHTTPIQEKEEVEAIQLHNWYIGLQATSQATSYHKDAEDINEWVQVFGVRYRNQNGSKHNKGKGKSKDQEVWHSSLILERVSPRLVKSKSGKVYELMGTFDHTTCMKKKDISPGTIIKFQNGFPTNWKDVILKEAILKRDQKNKKKTKSRKSNPSKSIERSDREEESIQPLLKANTPSTSTIPQERPIKSGKKLPEPQSENKKGRKRRGLFRFDDSESDESEYHPTSDEDAPPKQVQKLIRTPEREKESESHNMMIDITQDDESDESEYDAPVPARQNKQKESPGRRKSDQPRKEFDDEDYRSPSPEPKQRQTNQVDLDDGISVQIDLSPPSKTKSSNTKKTSKPISRELRNLSKTGFGDLTLVRNAIMEQLEENRSQRKSSCRHSMPSLKNTIQQQPFTPQSQIVKKINTPRSSRRTRTPVRPWWEVGPQEKKKKRFEVVQLNSTKPDLVDLTMGSSQHDQQESSTDSVYVLQEKSNDSEDMDSVAAIAKEEQLVKGKIELLKKESKKQAKRSGSELVKGSEKRQKKDVFDEILSDDSQEDDKDEESQSESGDESETQSISEPNEESKVEQPDKVLLKENVVDVSDDLQYIDDHNMEDGFVEMTEPGKVNEEQDDISVDTLNMHAPLAEKETPENDDATSQIEEHTDAVTKNIPLETPQQHSPEASIEEQEMEEKHDPSIDTINESVSIEAITDISESIFVVEKDESSKATSVDLSADEDEEIMEKIDVRDEKDEDKTDETEKVEEFIGGEEKKTEQQQQSSKDVDFGEFLMSSSSDTLVIKEKDGQAILGNTREVQNDLPNEVNHNSPTRLLHEDEAERPTKEAKASEEVVEFDEKQLRLDNEEEVNLKPNDFEDNEEDEDVDPDDDEAVEEVEALIMVADDEEKQETMNDTEDQEEILPLQNEVEQEKEAPPRITKHDCETPVEEDDQAIVESIPSPIMQKEETLSSSPVISKVVEIVKTDVMPIDLDEQNYPNLSQNEEMEVSVEFEALEITSTAIDSVIEERSIKENVKIENVDIQGVERAQITLSDVHSAIQNAQIFTKQDDLMINKIPLSPAEDSQMDDDDESCSDDQQSEIEPEDLYYFSD